MHRSAPSAHHWKHRRRRLRSSCAKTSIYVLTNFRPKTQMRMSLVTDQVAPINLKERQRDLKRVAKALDAVKTRLDENERSIEEAQQQMQAQEASRAEKQQEVDNLNKAIREQQRALQSSPRNAVVFSAVSATSKPPSAALVLYQNWPTQLHTETCPHKPPPLV